MTMLDSLSAALADRYAIERRLGEGGMATVYLAEDMRHERKVALKVLKPELAAVLGADRFVQEIKTTASLQHPHILPLFDSGEADSFLYYVMPYIEGETLREKLDRETQLSIEEAVQITTDVAEALQAAHEEGVIHRDIKPENIMLHKGRAMVADFGIALAVSAAAGGRMTETGLSLGTPHYMSPEQATAEKDITARSDVYSLGTVLYEMLAGSPPHVGSTAQQIIMKIVTDDVRPVTELRKSVPPNVSAALAKALEKLAADRFGSAAKFAEALANPTFAFTTTGGPVSSDGSSARTWSWVNSIGFGLAALFFATTLWTITRPEPAKTVVRFGIAFPEQEGLRLSGSSIALSPDGKRIVYTGPGEQGGSRLWVRELDQLGGQPVPGTDGATNVSISPDGQAVAFVTDAPGSLKLVDLSGGPAVTLLDDIPPQFDWGHDGYVYFSGPLAGALLRIRTHGGEPEHVVAHPDGSPLWPDALPSGRGVVYTVFRGEGSEIAVHDLVTGETQTLSQGLYARFAASGHVLIVSADGTLTAVPFDQEAVAVTGPIIPLIEGVGVGVFGSTNLTVSDNGTLLYVPGEGARESLLWVDREGEVEHVDPEWAVDFRYVALSPDATQLAISVFDGAGEDTWIHQLERGTRAKLTFEGRTNYRPGWFPDGGNVLFVSDRSGSHALYRKRADGSMREAELVFAHDADIAGALISQDGRWLVFASSAESDGNGDIFGLALGSDSLPVPLVTTQSTEAQPALSPDGRWLAYVSDESGRLEVYVVPFPNTAESRTVVSSAGGTEPAWAHSGRELFYKNAAGSLVQAELTTEPTFAVTGERTLFPVGDYQDDAVHARYIVTPDDERFLMIRNTPLDADATTSPAPVLVLNFFEELKAKVGNE
jgi:serine/threonine-protein kinase